jgi:hypothetical protein
MISAIEEAVEGEAAIMASTIHVDVVSVASRSTRRGGVRRSAGRHVSLHHPKHAPLITQIKPGEVRTARADEGADRLCARRFLQVRPTS